jgi:hypothetical protein
MNEKLWNLPWEIQLAVGSGYAAYMLAYLGIRDHHKAVDVTFRTIAFGLCATAALALVPSSWGWWRVAAAVFAALAGGILWRFWLSDGVHWLARRSNLSWSDDTPSAWSRITQHNRRIFYSQLAIQLDDDGWLFCEDTRPFDNAPFGPCVLGPNGDVALYVTHKCEPGGEIAAVEGIRDPHHGDEITYVPASRVRTFRVRLWRRSNDAELEVEELRVAAEEAP